MPVIASAISIALMAWLIYIAVRNARADREAQKEVSDLTNELLKQNAETLQMGTVAIAQESERGIVDIETVEEANRKLIETLDEVIRIQEEGRQKRLEAENTLGKIETELKQKLLEIKG